MDCEQSSSTAQKQRKVMWAEKKKKNSKGATLPISDRLEQARRRKIWKAMFGLSRDNEF